MTAAAHTDTAPVRAAETHEAVARLRQLVADNRQRLRAAILMEALGLTVAAPLAYLLFVLLLDNWLHLSLPGRLLASLGFFVGAAWAGHALWRRWQGLELSEDEVALAIEQQTPGGVQNRLINAVQLARDGRAADPVMTAAVVAENTQVLQRLHLEQAARLRPAVIRASIAGLVVVVGLGFAIGWPAHFVNAAARILFPLVPIDPLYRTRLTVEPGDVEARGDVTLTITVDPEGVRPESLTIIKTQKGQRTTETVPVPDDGPATYTLRDVNDDLDYAVRGGDFTSPTYRVTVPREAALVRLRVTYQYPAYTGLDERTVEGTGGDLEALHGTRARLVVRLDRPADEVTLVFDRPAAAKGGAARLGLTATDEREFTGDIEMIDLLGYRLEVRQGDRPVTRQGPFAVRVLHDLEPKLELHGLDRRTEVQVDSVLPLQVSATDDFGLDRVGLFYRRPRENADPKQAPPADDGWQPLQVWPVEHKTTFKDSAELAIEKLNVAEGDRLELALRAADTDPLRHGAWTTGPIVELTVGGEGVALQLHYEQILRSEADLEILQRDQQKLLRQAAAWLRKLDGEGNLRWDDAKNLDALLAGVKDISAGQEALRQSAGKAARAMLAQAGNVRLGLGMLADTEMVRVRRILDSVAGTPALPARRATLADARVTLERVGRSLAEIREQHAAFRADWELGHMTPFARMLAERQSKMRDQSRALAGTDARRASAFQSRSMARRQDKVRELCGLVRPAFLGISERIAASEPEIARAFTDGAATLAGAPLKSALTEASAAASAGRWDEAVRHQTAAAATLAALHAKLRDAQAEAARKALAALKEKLKSDLAAQKEIEKLAPGSAEAFVKDFPEKLKLTDLIRVRDVAHAKKKFGLQEKNTLDDPLAHMLDFAKGYIEAKQDTGVRQDTSTLTLAKKPLPGPELKLSKERGTNKVKPYLQEDFEDLVGKLLDETEDLTKNYETLTLSTNRNNNDPGDVGKIGGTLNSTGAVTATGNQKPPSLNSGGVSRTGRQGARAYGMVAGEEGVDRRGRDKAQEGHEQVADQAGTLKLHKSDDMQKDTSTGIGGKRVQSDDTHFSLHDAGKWKDDMAGRMQKPQKKHYIVERQGERIDAKVAAQLRDLTSKQEQVIERIKAIKKELRNLYLPTEHFDELAAALQSNLVALKERPDADLFRMQVRTLERLAGAIRVFQGAGGGFEPSLPRDRTVRGRVLDEPAAPTPPGYEDAVRSYFLRLANQ